MAFNNKLDKRMTPEEFQEKVVNRNKQINETRRKQTDINRYQREVFERNMANRSNYMSHNVTMI